MTTLTPLTCRADCHALLRRRGPLPLRDIATELRRYTPSTIKSTLSKDPLFVAARSPDHAGVRLWSVVGDAPEPRSKPSARKASPSAQRRKPASTRRR